MATLILRDTHRALEKKMKSLDKLKKETSLKIRDAASHGDLKENGEYHAARELQSLIIYKKQLMQSHTPFQIIENSEIETDNVGFGPGYCSEELARIVGENGRVISVDKSELFIKHLDLIKQKENISIKPILADFDMLTLD